MSSYINKINRSLTSVIQESGRTVFCFGQNINTGSRLSGLTANFNEIPNLIVRNTPNCESSLVGMGLGSMLMGLNSIFFAKQLDFLFLASDHYVNTLNAFKHREISGSFVIFLIVVDSGFEGPQSCANNLHDLGKLNNLEIHTLPHSSLAKNILEINLLMPGFRIIAVSQKKFKTIENDLSFQVINKDTYLIEAEAESKKSEISIAVTNFAIEIALNLKHWLEKKKYKVNLYFYNDILNLSEEEIFFKIGSVKLLIIVDDSKSQNLFLNCKNSRKVYRIKRDEDQKLLRPNDDLFELTDKHLIDIIKLLEADENQGVLDEK